MRRIRYWVNDLGIKRKLIFYGYLTIAPILISLCVFLLFYNYNKKETDKRESNLSSVNTLAEGIDVLQADIKDFSTYICINHDVIQILKYGEAQKLNQDARLWEDYAPMEIVQDMISLKGHIKTIAIYPENGVRPYLRGMDGSAYVADMETIRQTDVYQETGQSDGGMLWRREQKGFGEVYQSNRSDKIVLYREIFDLNQRRTLGYIVIGVDQSYFQQLCDNAVKDDKERVLVLDKNGGELIRTGDLDKEVAEYLGSDEFVNQNYQERETHFTYGNYDIVCNQKSKNASIVCKVVPRSSLRTQFWDIAYMPLILLAGVLVGLLPVLLLISNLVTKPLMLLSVAIQKFSTGDFSQQVEVTTGDEVGLVAECFNQMVQDIKKLIDQNYVITLKEQESELAALQAQINPHFLYNTLDSLYWQATEAGNDEVAENILALSQLFRLVLSRGQKNVTVEQEMELITQYLKIQKMRFTKRMNYQLELDPSIKNIVIPKLILQPFVENAIVHGFENVSTPCFLKVTGQGQGEELVFTIEDTGVGMTQEQMDEIWVEEPVAYAKQRIGRYAIKNIKERLELKYHGNFKLEIRSEVGKGTTVVLRIPNEGDELCL